MDARVALAVLAATATLSLARAAPAQEPVPMTPDEPGTPPAGTWPVRPRAAPERPARKGHTGLLATGATMFLLSGIQIPIGVALMGSNDDGVHAFGIVMVAIGAGAGAVGIPLLIAGAAPRTKVEGDEELALRIGPRGVSLVGTF